MSAVRPPEALEALLGAGGSPQEAFLRLLLSTLTRLEESSERVEAKLDAHTQGQAKTDAAQDAQIADHGRRLSVLEDARKDGRDQAMKWLGVAVSVVSLLLSAGIGLAALHAHH